MINIKVIRNHEVFECLGFQMIVTPQSDHESTVVDMTGETRTMLRREPWGKLWIRLSPENMFPFEATANHTIEICDGNRAWSFYDAKVSNMEWSDQYPDDPIGIDITIFYRSMDFNASVNHRRILARYRANARYANLQKLDWREVGF